ncbi:MAG: hypothetical protein MUO68_14400, partial [Desulfobacteraceae bacterium]|nr:hypothetical protein [Desulfobacteraceae bacterium]
MAFTPFPTPPQAGFSISGSELPLQHHEVDFGLTLKAESPMVCPQKRSFLSTQLKNMKGNKKMQIFGPNEL